MQKMGKHRNVNEYDGAYKCLDCQAQWGEIPGHPEMPDECKPPPSEPAAMPSEPESITNMRYATLTNAMDVVYLDHIDTLRAYAIALAAQLEANK